MTKNQLKRLLDSDGGDGNQDVQIYIKSPILGSGYAYFDVDKVTTVGPLGHDATGTVLEVGDFRTGGES